MKTPSSKLVALAIAIVGVLVGVCLSLVYNQKNAGIAVACLAFVVAMAASPPHVRAWFARLTASLLNDLSRGFQHIAERLDPTTGSCSVYTTEHFFDDQGIRVELVNLNCTVQDRKRVGDFASEFVTAMIHQPPANRKLLLEENPTMPTSGDTVRGDTRRPVTSDEAVEHADS